MTGRIAEWKGKFGWIQPDKPISHPEARMHKGQVYLSQMDVEAEISGVGAHVSFFAYADGSGLGAMNCRPAGSVPVQPTVMKQTPQAKPAAQSWGGSAGRQMQSMAPGVKKRVSNCKVMGQVKTWKGGFGWIVPAEPVKHPLFRGQIYVKGSDVKGTQSLEPGTMVSFYIYADSQGLGAEDCIMVDESGAPVAQVASTAGAKSDGGRVPLGPRERLTVVPTTGEVCDWKGSFGFIRPHEAVDHPQAGKRDGKVYVAKRDIEGNSELSVGQLVQFHVFVDNSGLGAEECMPF